MNENILNHYNRLASNYDQFWAYSNEFVSFISKNIIRYLNLKEDDRLVDLGCGTGIYSKEILRQMKLKHKILCVDISEKMLLELHSEKGITTINHDAIEFTQKSYKYNKVFIKEMIHHISSKDKSILFDKLYDCLDHNGTLLIIMLPPTIDYPLFKDALKLYQKLQPHYNEIANGLETAGFKVNIDFVEYPLSINKGTYIQMVKERYMSLLSNFSDEEIQKGVIEIMDKYKEETDLKFNDRFVFISGLKE
ncbi:class I SAM-dependent methyltransferase [Paenactinomyces guangxiensis]|uniref:Class I SAM-dependent methyltransferase n=1 Tax=Paenactinomyces guangxiensis TaxID=1490290 RepID=A0A7W1WUI4_9BACL|nr:class I SAM-dependent methyltransferase [Paenactinomyces guangxiensis]MBA4496320.1 class I SAM-dependent methyltransferase [Paenactinomyces guangxiensis]MBH8590849.1 class I SAM-dependent methyltransferase [Paenactinomyces guangxiensis]